ncbi:MAG: choice-of-anchor V domain-containing protein [Saprospiraceae bacterium]
MKIKFTYTLAALLLCSIAFLGNKNGRASQAGKGNTGAPGDETSPSGLKRTCGYCHASTQIFSDMEITILDSMGNAISEYIPESQYTARVRVNATGNGIAGYGFQMIALRDSGYVDLDGFTDMNPNNYKIATTNSNGRTYAEHDNISSVDSFLVKWTAPPAGTGNITFYASGNAVNGNGQSSGDGPCNDSLKLTEAVLSSNLSLQVPTFELSAYPNPVQDQVNFVISVLKTEVYKVDVFNQSGQQVYNGNTQLVNQYNQLRVDASNWTPGVYYARLSGAGQSKVIKLVK